MDPGTGDAFNVSRSPQSEDRCPCWSPDGKRIAFISDRNNSTNLYVVKADGTGVKRIVTSPAICYMPSWQKTPNGERIVFGMHGERPEMASLRPNGADLRMLGVGHDPCLSPDGKAIAYTGEVWSRCGRRSRRFGLRSQRGQILKRQAACDAANLDGQNDCTTGKELGSAAITSWPKPFARRRPRPE